MSKLAFLRRLGRDCRGASVVELAFAAPLLALFVTGIVDLGQGLSDRFTMQQAVNRSLEILQAGPVQANAEGEDVDYSFLVTEAANAAGVPQANVSLRQWLECDNVPQDNYEANCNPGQETARYLQLRISKTFEGSFFFDGYPMSATAAMRIQ